MPLANSPAGCADNPDLPGEWRLPNEGGFKTRPYKLRNLRAVRFDVCAREPAMPLLKLVQEPRQRRLDFSAAVARRSAWAHPLFQRFSLPGRFCRATQMRRSMGLGALSRRFFCCGELRLRTRKLEDGVAYESGDPQRAGKNRKQVSQRDRRP